MAGTDGAARLQEALRGDVPPGIAALPDSVLTEVAELVLDARRRQAVALQEAFEATLKHVPFPVRGIVRKVLVG